MNAGDGGDQRQHGFDALAGKQGRASGGPAESHGPAVDTPKCFARAGEVGLGTRIQLHPLEASRDEPFG